MGIFFTLLYVVMAYLAPSTLLGDFAQYHIQIVVVLIALVCSLIGGNTSGFLRMPQTYAVFGLILSVAFSIIFNGWFGGAPGALMEFIPNALVFFLIVWNFRKRSHLQILFGALFLVACFIIYHGLVAQRGGGAPEGNSMDVPYVLSMVNGAGEYFFRIRGLDFLGDPNDLAQFFVGLIPCMFFFWRSGRSGNNFLFVIVPVSILFYGMFLTHSRGGMVALLAVAIILGRRKIGVLPAVITGAILFIGLSAVGWSGGRDVSADSGADRMEAWATGLGLIRTHPLFGVGYQQFTEYFYITAHNTVIVCAAELGLIGFFFWTLFIVTTVRDVTLAARDPNAVKKKEESEDESAASSLPRIPTLTPAFRMPLIHSPGMQVALSTGGSDAGHFREADLPPSYASSSSAAVSDVALHGISQFEESQEALPDEEIRRLCGLVVLCFTGFFTAGWFLSRSYTMVLFLNTGVAVSVYHMALERGIAPEPVPLGKASKNAGIAAISLIALVYIILRIDHLMPK